MRNLFSILAFIFILTPCFAQTQNNKYQFYLDLNKVNGDKLKISLTTPQITSDIITYNIPKIVPGTYQVYDFGQYTTKFKAFNKDGEPLKVKQLDKNRWEISNAKTLDKITYWSEDTWDADVENFVFEPGGTNIEENNIVLNNHGFFGYFDNMKNLTYEINITRPSHFYGSTGLATGSTIENKDRYTTANYMDLVDSPIMYNVPDTTIIKVGETDVLISVYSENKTVSAKELAKDIKAILELQKDYLGKLPVKKYAFIIYLFSGNSKSGGMGALEHSYSSFYYLPEMSAKDLSNIIVRIAAHEFFHIVTPLNIHSEEIGDFDFIHPKISKHLWLYEGVTEYFAGHVQVYGNMVTPEEYLEIIQEKLYGAEQFKDDLPFTEMSLGCLDQYKNQYYNVYLKGALIGLCLDIMLREQSNGETGLKDITNKLAVEYGKNVSFKDDELFDKIAELSFPEIRLFFKKHVEGEQPLPLAELFNKVGITYKEHVVTHEITLGGIALDANPETNRLIIMNTEEMNDFGYKLGYKKNDEIISINGIDIKLDNTQKVIDKFKKTTNPGDKVEVVVVRKIDGTFKTKKLKGKAVEIEKTQDFLLEFNKNSSKEQLQLRNAWLRQH